MDDVSSEKIVEYSRAELIRCTQCQNKFDSSKAIEIPFADDGKFVVIFCAEKCAHRYTSKKLMEAADRFSYLVKLKAKLDTNL